MIFCVRCFHILVLLALFATAHCATARPDPVRIADLRAARHELKSAQSPVKIEIIEANLHADLEFFPDRHGLYYRLVHKEVPVLNWSPLGLETDSQSFVSDLNIRGIQKSALMHDYTLAHGKRSQVTKPAERFECDRRACA